MNRRSPTRSRWFAGALAALLAIASCQAEPDETTGGETHFLRVCQPGDGTCGGVLSCVCGVCSVPCEAQNECAPFVAAQCTTPAVGSCGDAESPKMCGVTCGRDQDCEVVSAEHRCVQGQCRQGGAVSASGGEGGLGPVVASGGQGGTGPVVPSGGQATASGGSSGCATVDVGANEVVIVGDSFFAVNHEIAGFLEEQGRLDGVLGAGERYRDISRLTQNALALSSKGIRSQYVSAYEDAPVKVVIMNGGGADILLGSCDTVDASCPMIAAAGAELVDLLKTMATDQVNYVVFVGYPDPVPSAALAKMDALRPLLEAACAGSEVPCLWVDLRTEFADHYAEYVQGDGLNPTSLGSSVAAQAIAREMDENCVPR